MSRCRRCFCCYAAAMPLYRRRRGKASHYAFPAISSRVDYTLLPRRVTPRAMMSRQRAMPLIYFLSPMMPHTRGYCFSRHARYAACRYVLIAAATRCHTLLPDICRLSMRRYAERRCHWPLSFRCRFISPLRQLRHTLSPLRCFRQICHNNDVNAAYFRHFTRYIRRILPFDTPARHFTTILPLYLR